LSILSSRRWLRGVDRFGIGIVFHGKPYISNLGKLEIGNDVFVSSLPVQTHLIAASRGRLLIGDRVSIGHGVAIAAHSVIEIGDDVQISPYVIIMDSDYRVAGRPGAQPERTPVYIGPRTRIGAHSTIMRGSNLGEDVEVAPGSVVSGRTSAGQYIAGNPARVLNRNTGRERALGIEDQTIDAVVRALDLDRRSIDVDQSLQSLPQWDSLGVLRVLLMLEEQFEITLQQDEISSVDRLSELVAIVEDASVRTREHPLEA
jgi:acetyltransferase-like isoleucine patch superfamily enzyme/acyl carrier protein